jgi:ketosteroid isomerase-like protein
MQDDQKRGNLDSVIEKAMSRLAERSPDVVEADEQKERKRLGLGRRDYDQVLVERLDEIRAMARLGQVTLPAPPAVASSDAAPQHTCHRTGTLLLAMLASTIIGAGAGAAWFAGPEATQRAAPAEPPAAVAPVAVPLRPEVVAAAGLATAPGPGDDDQVRALVEAWRSAWAERDVDAYLACYSADFIPANGQTRDAWASARRKNIAGRSGIIVATNGLTLERLDGRQMKARFLQDYASGSYRETAQPKTLLVVRGEAGWQIAGEWQGEAPAAAVGAD